MLLLLAICVVFYFFFSHYSFGVVVVVVVVAIKCEPAALLLAACLLTLLFLVLSFPCSHQQPSLLLRCFVGEVCRRNGKSFLYLPFLVIRVLCYCCCCCCCSHAFISFWLHNNRKQQKPKNNSIKKLREICEAAAPVGHNSIITSNVSLTTAATSVATPCRVCGRGVSALDVNAAPSWPANAVAQLRAI